VLLALLIGLAGCQSVTSYDPSYVPAEASMVVGERIEGKARIYMTEADRDYVFNGGASTFTGSGAKVSVPLGVMTWEIGKSIYGSAFTDGVEATHAMTDDARFLVTIQPRVSDFKYYFHQLENLGFAVTPGVELTLTVALLDVSGKLVQTKTYASGEKKAGSYMVSFSPEQKVSRLAHEVMADLMRQSLADVRNWLATVEGAVP